MEEQIKIRLMSLGYPERDATVTAKNLLSMTTALKEALAEWMSTGKETIVEANGYTSASLMSRFKGMTYPAALLTIDWIINDPALAIKVIEKGIR